MIKVIKKKGREEKGAITILVIATVLFFMTILMTAYVVNSTIRKGQLESTIRVKEVYEAEFENTEIIYAAKTRSSVYREDFNAWNNYNTSGTTINSCNSILDITSTNNDPMIHMNQVTSFSPKLHRYVEVKYKTNNSNATRMELFMIENPTNQTYSISKTIKSDGLWHTVVFDLWSNQNIKNRENITGWRFDWVGANNVTMQIDYIRVF